MSSSNLLGSQNGCNDSDFLTTLQDQDGVGQQRIWHIPPPLSAQSSQIIPSTTEICNHGSSYCTMTSQNSASLQQNDMTPQDCSTGDSATEQPTSIQGRMEEVDPTFFDQVEDDGMPSQGSVNDFEKQRVLLGEGQADIGRELIRANQRGRGSKRYF